MTFWRTKIHFLQCHWLRNIKLGHSQSGYSSAAGGDSLPWRTRSRIVVGGEICPKLGKTIKLTFLNSKKRVIFSISIFCWKLISEICRRDIQKVAPNYIFRDCWIMQVEISSRKQCALDLTQTIISILKIVLLWKSAPRIFHAPRVKTNFGQYFTRRAWQAFDLKWLINHPAQFFHAPRGKSISPESTSKQTSSNFSREKQRLQRVDFLQKRDDENQKKND